jgi:DNA ligase (NAD+)
MPEPLSRDNVSQRVQKLREEIACHEKKYSVDNDPQISDDEFDQLIRELGVRTLSEGGVLAAD